jgi:hypothetical protein
MRFVLSGAAASIDQFRSGAGAAGSHGTDQVAAKPARVHCIAAAGRGSGIFRASFMTQAGFMQAQDAPKLIFGKRIQVPDSGKRQITAGLAALIET